MAGRPIERVGNDFRFLATCCSTNRSKGQFLVSNTCLLQDVMGPAGRRLTATVRTSLLGWVARRGRTGTLIIWDQPLGEVSFGNDGAGNQEALGSFRSTNCP